jgi:hypothetical protein
LPYDVAGQRRSFYVSVTALLDMERPYAYFLPRIKALLEPDRQ